MNSRVYPITIVIIALVTVPLFLLGCDGDGVGESLQQTYDFDYQTDPLVVTGVSGACLPIPSLETMMASYELWGDIRDRVEEVRVRSVYYQVTENQTPLDGRIEIHAADSLQDIADAQLVLESQLIFAQTTYLQWTRANFVGDGKDVLEDYLNDFQRSFALCGLFDPPDEQVNLTLLLQINIEILYSPL